MTTKEFVELVGQLRIPGFVLRGFYDEYKCRFAVVFRSIQFPPPSYLFMDPLSSSEIQVFPKMGETENGFYFSDIQISMIETENKGSFARFLTQKILAYIETYPEIRRQIAELN